MNFALNTKGQTLVKLCVVSMQTGSKEESNVVLLEPDIARAFPNDEAVNKALRYLLEIAEASSRLTGRCT